MDGTHTHVESILVAREERLANLLTICYDAVEQYSSLGLPSSSNGEICDYEDSGIAKQCDTFVLGSLIRGLRSLALLPGPIEASSMSHCSVTELAVSVVSLKCARNPSYGDGWDDHKKCMYTYILRRKVFAQNEAAEPSGILDSHRKHIEEQAKK